MCTYLGSHRAGLARRHNDADSDARGVIEAAPERVELAGEEADVLAQALLCDDRRRRVDDSLSPPASPPPPPP